MIRNASLMRVHPDAHAEYERRHSPLWEELAETLRAHGARSHSIFLHPEGSQLFLPTNADNSPTPEEMRCVFHMD